MSKFSNIFSALFLTTILTSNIAFGIGSEFKNSLVKMELTKVTEGSYNVDLYTKNKYTDPVKIIKKSDSNYYILLPETRNEIGRAVQPNADIKSAGVMSAPYAGQDVNNGYIKIDINTTKPINFNVNVKSVAAAAPIAPAKTKVASEQKEAEDVTKLVTPKKIQKKNTASYSSKTSNQIAKTNTYNYKKNYKKNTNVRKKSKTRLNYNPEVFELTNEEIDNIKELPPLPPEIASLNMRKADDTSRLKEIKPEKKEVKQLAKEPKELKTKAPKIEEEPKEKAEFNLVSFGMFFVNFILGIFALIALAFVVIAAIKSQKNAQVKLDKKANLLGIDFNKAKTKLKETAKMAKESKFFVFDKGVKQNAIMEPVTPVVAEEQPIENEVKSDNEILQKALKEEQETVATPEVAFEDVIAVAQEVEVQKEIEEQREPQVASCPITQNEVSIQEVPEVAPRAVVTDEPTVLSSVEIGPKRGFMCVTYKNRVSLLGYIFDDVYVLYNFNRRASKNYDIQYRLTDKIGKESFYIVKVADVKMLIKVSKTNMSREVIL